jgi:methyltransferase (TIGR00027 family)
VILAAGLDARTWRLDWPAGAVVYEIDQPKMLAFKTSTLEAHCVAPIATHVSVPVDLRHNWPAALVSAGFDPGIPTAWSAEGLLPYLPADAQDLMFDRVQGLSSTGSRVAVEAFTNDFFSAESFARRGEQMQRYRSALGQPDSAESGNLVYEEERTEVIDWLTEHNWDITTVAAEDLMANNGRRPGPCWFGTIPRLSRPGRAPGADLDLLAPLGHSGHACPRLPGRDHRQPASHRHHRLSADRVDSQRISPTIRRTAATSAAHRRRHPGVVEMAPKTPGHRPACHHRKHDHQQ